MKHDQPRAVLTSRKSLPGSRPTLLRTTKLNTYGWAAMALFCVTGAGLTYLAARVVGSSGKAPAAAGALACLLMLIALDRRRWMRMYTSYSWTEDSDAIAHAAALLRARGVPVYADVDAERGARLVYRHRDRRRVRRGLQRAGIPAPS